MNDDSLNSLFILNIETEITNFLKYHHIIKEFASQKAHRKI